MSYSKPKKRRRKGDLGSVAVSGASSVGCMKPTHLSEHNDAYDLGGSVRDG
jgi:hypothetical protein